MSNEGSPERMVMTILEGHVASEKWATLGQILPNHLTVYRPRC